jgi:hypothetical protein
MLNVTFAKKAMEAEAMKKALVCDTLQDVIPTNRQQTGLN